MLSARWHGSAHGTGDHRCERHYQCMSDEIDRALTYMIRPGPDTIEKEILFEPCATKCPLESTMVALTSPAS